MFRLSDYGQKLVAGAFFLLVAVAVVAVQVFNVGDRPATSSGSGIGAGPSTPLVTQSAAPSPSTSGPVQPSQLMPVPLADMASLAEDAVEFAAVLEDSSLAPPDKYARLEGRAGSLAVNDPARLPQSREVPPRIRLDKAVLVTPDYVTFAVINEEQPDKPRYLSFSFDGSQWIVSVYTDNPGIGHD